MKKALLLFIILWPVSLLSQNQQDSIPNNEGLMLYLNEKFIDAAKKFEAVYQNDHTKFLDYLYAANSYLRAKERQKANTILKELLNSDYQRYLNLQNQLDLFVNAVYAELKLNTPDKERLLSLTKKMLSSFPSALEDPNAVDLIAQVYRKTSDPELKKYYVPFQTEGFYIFSIPQNRFNSVENSMVYRNHYRGAQYEYSEDFFAIKFDSDEDYKLYYLKTDKGVRGVSAFKDRDRNWFRNRAITVYKNAILKDYGYRVQSESNIAAAKNDSDGIIILNSKSFAGIDKVIKGGLGYDAYSVHEFAPQNGPKMAYSGKTFNREWHWEGSTVVWEPESKSNIWPLSINNINMDFIPLAELTPDAIAQNLKNIRQENEARKKQLQIQEEQERIAKAKYNEERLRKLKAAQVGDRICFSQGFIREERFLWTTFTTDNYQMNVICYIERKEGDRLQIRVASIRSNSNSSWSVPKINGIELTEQSLHWIKPSEYLTNPAWNICD